MLNENRDQSVFEIRGTGVAGALSAKRPLQTSKSMRGERNLFQIGDPMPIVTQRGSVASAEPTNHRLKPSASVSASAPIPIGDQLVAGIRISVVPGERSTISLVKPIPLLSSAHTYPEIGCQRADVSLKSPASDVDRRVGPFHTSPEIQSSVERLT